VEGLSRAETHHKIEANMAWVVDVNGPYAQKTEDLQHRIKFTNRLRTVREKGDGATVLISSRDLRELELLAAELSPDARPGLMDLGTGRPVNVTALDGLEGFVGEGFATDAEWMIDISPKRSGALDETRVLIGTLPERDREPYLGQLSEQQRTVVRQEAKLPKPTNNPQIHEDWAGAECVIEGRAILDRDVNRYTDPRIK